ncbi:hemerythrin domain-containing protein [Chitinispirillales bacterium ANBcel5]|uniref:hemerythrin domain-containing protein n=1 Tax=Cellulosispirillum alkaliphilum TaxID=3039283 RepID=UPI002A4FAA88|nr:hemerythrin domain-containing protein [Chitinispirillales bacterium ANBcel5]
MERLLNDLNEQHSRIRMQLAKLEALPSADDWEKRELEFAKLKDVLLPHLSAEEKILFPHLVSDPSDRWQINYYLEQHALIWKSSSELSERSKQAQNWGAGMRVMDTIIQNHLDSEQEQYPHMLTIIDEKNLEKVYQRFLQEEIRFRKELQNRKTMPW